MAKNKNNNFKANASAGNKYTAGNSSQSTSTTKDSAKNTHAQVPDNSPKRSGPGGE
jgi:hypothetical protein